MEVTMEGIILTTEALTGAGTAMDIIMDIGTADTMGQIITTVMEG
jgi:hypothetical protein